MKLLHKSTIKNKLKIRLQNKSFIDYVIMMFSIMSLISIIFIILAYFKYYCHSDCAAYLFLAKEQTKQLKMFPNKFHYTTEIFWLSPSVLMAPFVNIISNDYLLHEVGSILAIIIVYISIYVLFRESKRMSGLVSILFFIPLSYVYIDMLFFQSAYINLIFFIILMLCVSKMILKIRNNITMKQLFLVTFIYSFSIIIIDYASLRPFLIITIPAFCAIIVLLVEENGFNLKGWLSQKILVYLLICTGILLCVGVIHYFYLSNKLNSDAMPNGFIDSSNLIETWTYVIQSIFQLFGIEGTSGLITISTIENCATVLYIAMSIFLIPIYIVKRVYKKLDLFKKFIVCYVLISNFFLIFMMLFIMGCAEGRYYLSAVFNNILLIVLFVDYLLQYKKEWCSYVPVLIILLYALLVHTNYYVSIAVGTDYNKNLSISQLVNPQREDDVVSVLKENDLNYGYATFWQSYSRTMISNGDIQFVAYDQGKPTVPYYFDSNDGKHYYGVSEDLYDYQNHVGKCFVLVAPGEQVPNVYYSLADEQIDVNGFKILVYHKNINLYTELVNY